MRFMGKMCVRQGFLKKTLIQIKFFSNAVLLYIVLLILAAFKPVMARRPRLLLRQYIQF